MWECKGLTTRPAHTKQGISNHATRIQCIKLIFYFKTTRLMTCYGLSFFSINGWVFKVKSCLANRVQFSGHQVKILNLKHDIKHHHQWKTPNEQLLLWNLQTVSFSNLIAAVSGDQCNCKNWDFSVKLCWFHIENESYHTKITFELEKQVFVFL